MTRDLSENLRPGDVVTMSSTRLPEIPRFRAAVESVGEGQVSFFSNEVAPFTPSTDDMTFDIGSTDLTIFDRLEAPRAVPIESRGWSPGDRVRLKNPVPGHGIVEGNLVAALNGFLYATTDEGEDFGGGKAAFEKVPQSE